MTNNEEPNAFTDIGERLYLGLQAMTDSMAETPPLTTDRRIVAPDPELGFWDHADGPEPDDSGAHYTRNLADLTRREINTTPGWFESGDAPRNPLGNDPDPADGGPDCALFCLPGSCKLRFSGNDLCGRAPVDGSGYGPRMYREACPPDMQVRKLSALLPVPDEPAGLVFGPPSRWRRARLRARARWAGIRYRLGCRIAGSTLGEDDE